MSQGLTDYELKDDSVSSASFSSSHQQVEVSSEKKSDESTSSYLKCGVLPELALKECYMDDDNVEKHCTPLTWSNCDATTFAVRQGPNYKKLGNKAPSLASLYDAFAVDTYKSTVKINKISQFVDLRERMNELNKEIGADNHSYSYDKWPLPPIVIINFMIPNYSSSLMSSSSKSDGNGFSLVLYSQLSKETLKWMKKLYKNEITKDELPASIQLLIKFIHASESRDSNGYGNNGTTKNNSKYGMSKKEIEGMLSKFKAIVRVMNYSKSQISSSMKPIIKNYNGKPFLAKTSSTFYHCPGQYFGVDVDVHLFGKLARKSLGYFRKNMDSVIFDAGFVIEGLNDDELPEQLLCSARISKINPSGAKEFPKHLVNDYLKRKELGLHTSYKYDVNCQSNETSEKTKNNEKIKDDAVMATSA